MCAIIGFMGRIKVPSQEELGSSLGSVAEAGSFNVPEL